MARAASRPHSTAYVLHSHDWSESSLIIDLFTREQGRVVAVAKGAKRPYSQLRPVLMPFQRLTVGFGVRRKEEDEVWLLRQAEWAGGPAWPGGAALLPGFYLNELLMRMLQRHDPHPALFDAYANALSSLASPPLLQAGLRAFELTLLRQLGHLPDLSALTVNGQAVQADSRYELHPEWGVAQADPRSPPAECLSGALLRDIEAALRQGGDERGVSGSPQWGPLMAACLPALNELKSALRSLLHYHLGTQTLRTRQLMMELHQA